MLGENNNILVGGIKQLGISLTGSCIFFFFFAVMNVHAGHVDSTACSWENAWSPSLNDSPVKWGVEFCLSLSFVFFAHSTYFSCIVSVQLFPWMKIELSLEFLMWRLIFISMCTVESLILKATGEIDPIYWQGGLRNQG